MRYNNREEVSEIEVMSGAFCMVRRKALDQVGLLDEDFFMYGEDIDLSYRLLKSGWKNYYLPTPILHYKGESTQKSSFRYVHVFYEAMLIFFDKHYSRRYRLLSLFIRLAVRLRAGIDLLLRLWKRFTQWVKPDRPEDNAPHMEDYVVRTFGETTYDEMHNERIKGYEQGDRRQLGVHYPESGLTILPYNILAC